MGLLGRAGSSVLRACNGTSIFEGMEYYNHIDTYLKPVEYVQCPSWRWTRRRTSLRGSDKLGLTGYFPYVASALLRSRSLHVSASLKAKESSPVFNVQDEDDFQTRVLESSVPVIVDFHAK